MEQTLWTDINYTLLALQGHEEMMTNIFGSGKPADPSTPPLDARGNPIVLTPAAFDTTFEFKKNGIRVKN